MKKCAKCGKEIGDDLKTCTECGAVQIAKKSKLPWIIGIIVGGVAFLGLTFIGILVVIFIFLGSKYSTDRIETTENSTYEAVNTTTEALETEGTTTETANLVDTTEAATGVEYVIYEDEYLKYEIPSTWKKNDSYTDDSLNMTVFDPSSPITDMPSNINITINNFENGAELAGTDYGDEEVQQNFYMFLLSQVGSQLPQEAGTGTFAVINIGDHYVYTLDYDREVDGKVIHQKLYTPMGYDYTMAIYATDWADGENPSANQVAEHLIETLEVK